MHMEQEQGQKSTAKNYVLLLRAMKRDSEADELEARFPPDA
jgi:hypothetical protein